MTAAPVPVVFIHGLWIHSDAWQPWVELYRSAGYDATAPGWPGDAASADDTRKNPAAVANKGIDDITSGYLDVISALSARPVVIGHSFGGLVAQKLLAGGAAAAAIAIDPGQIKGVRPLPFAQIRSGLPVLSRPGNKKRAVMLTRKQFRYGFGNVLSESESGELYERYAIPGPPTSSTPVQVRSPITTRSLTAATRSSSTTDGAKSPTTPCPGSPARTCDTNERTLSCARHCSS